MKKLNSPDNGLGCGSECGFSNGGKTVEIHDNGPYAIGPRYCKIEQNGPTKKITPFTSDPAPKLALAGWKVEADSDNSRELNVTVMTK